MKMAEIKVNESNVLEVFQHVTNAATGLASIEATIEMATSSLDVLEQLNHLEKAYQAQLKSYMETLNKTKQESQQLIKIYGEIDRALANQ